MTVTVWLAKPNMFIFLNLYKQSLLIPGLNNFSLHVIEFLTIIITFIIQYNIKLEYCMYRGKVHVS